jgi:hypothetical protein
VSFRPFIPNDRPEAGRENGNGGSSCCHCSIRRLSHRWASSYACHLGEMLLARAPDLFIFESGCLYET